MKKIKRAKQLTARQRLIQKRSAQLEATIEADWKALKKSLRPHSLFKELYSLVK